MSTIQNTPDLQRPEDAGFRTMDLEARFGPAPLLLPAWLDALPSAWRRFVYLLGRAGLVGEVTRDRIPPGDPPLAIFSAFPRLSTRDTDGHIPPWGFARGVARSEPEALSKALGEFLERYALAVFREEDLVIGSPASFAAHGNRFLHPGRLAGFSNAQRQWFPERAFDEASTFAWARGQSLGDGRPILIPAQLVFWNYCGTCGELDEPFVRERNTNGAAGAFSREAALLAAVYELVERDGFLLAWLTSRPPARIEAADIADPDLASLIGTARRHGLEPVFLDTTSDLGIPSTVCVTVSDRPGEPRFICGGSASLDPIAALRRALTESLGVRAWAKKYAPVYRLPPDYVPFRTRGVDQAARVGLWSAARGVDLDGFLSGPREPLEAFLGRGRRSGSASETLAHLAQALRRRGQDYDILFYEAAHPILELVGYHVVRAIVPALLPLYMNEENTPLGAERLGSEELPTGLNPVPHPFP